MLSRGILTVSYASKDFNQKLFIPLFFYLIMVEIIAILALMGILLSFYALYIEKKLEKNKNYKPVCDLSDKFSCSKNFTSRDAKIFFIPNSLLGILFYLIIMILAIFNLNSYIFYIAIPAFLFNIYLAYASYIKLKNFCLICTLTYLIVILILILSYLKM